MDRVIVTVKRPDALSEYDVELPAHVQAVDLIPALMAALQWDRSNPRFVVIIQPQEHPLRHAETLAEVNAWDGSVLFFHPAGSGLPPDLIYSAERGSTDLPRSPVLPVGFQKNEVSQNYFRWKPVGDDKT